MEAELFVPIRDAIESGITADVIALLTSHPDMIHYMSGKGTWLHIAATEGFPDIISELVRLGCDVNAISVGMKRTPLNDAITFGNVSSVSALLKHGADPNNGRAVISAVTTRAKSGLEMLKLLATHGADLHRIFPYGHDDRPINALSMAKAFGKSDFVEYLLSRGARLPEDYSREELEVYAAGRVPATKHAELSADVGAMNTADETIAYFREHFGPVDELALIEIIPNEPQVTVHFIPADESRKHVTLFTTGLANLAMDIPEDQPEAAEFRHAELFLQLPGDWKYRDYEDPQHGWPIHWLRKIAQFPAANDTWLGGPVTIYDAGEPLGPDLRFDSWLLMAERKYQTRDGRTVQLYRLTPLYPEERELEKREGIGALLRAFDAQGTPFVIDLDRKNVAS